MARRPLSQRLRRAWGEIAGSPSGSRHVRSAIYAGANTGRLFSDWVASTMAPDDETRMSLRRLRARARDLDRNNGLAHHFFNLLEIHVVGPSGLALSAQVRDPQGNLAKQTNVAIEEAWYRWADGPVSYDETMDFVTLQKLLIRTTAMDGEAYVRIHRDTMGPGLLLEPIDADLLDEGFNRPARGGDNEIRMGIELDSRGRRVAYHLSDPGGYSAIVRKPERVPASDMIHIFNPRRISQTRGVTWLTPSMYALRQEGAYTDAELVGARIGSSSMGFYYRDMAEGVGGVDPRAAGTAEEDAGGAPQGEFRDEVEPGTFSKLPDGWKFQPFDPQHPTTAYGDFTKNIVRRIASGLSVVSYESLSNDRESTTYSSARTGILLERDAMKSLHSWWTFMLLRRVHREWLNWALLSGSLRLEGRSAQAYLAAKWMPRGWDWVDPVKDVQAAILAINNGLGSRRQYLSERGLDWEEVIEELAEEKKFAVSLGVDLVPPGPQAAPRPPAADEMDEPEPEEPAPKPRELLTAALNGKRLAALRGSGR